MHMSEAIGGWDFWDENHEMTIEKARFVDLRLLLIFIIFNPNIAYNLILLVVVGKAHLNACSPRKLHLLCLLQSLEW